MMTKLFITSLSLVVLLSVDLVCSLDNGLALTPPMGFMTWQRYRCTTDCVNYPDECIDEKLIKVTAEHMAYDGWLRAGYQYIIIDDCWLAHTRDKDGKLQPDSKRFPSGIKALADYVHNLGLKFGIYEDYGTLTCGGYPGILGHMKQDVDTFASWGVDYIKLDGCYSNATDQPEAYALFAKYLNQTGRPIVFSCSYPAYQPDVAKINSTLLQQSCNLWRIYSDIDDAWSSVNSIINFWSSDVGNMSEWNGPGHWNDPDMLVIGNFGLSKSQQETQMALWCIFSAPLLLSVDLKSISLESAKILTNPLAIAVNQDPLGISGRPVVSQLLEEEGAAQFQVWLKPMKDHRYALALTFYSAWGTRWFSTLTLEQMGIPKGSSWFVFDIFMEESLGTFKSEDKVPVYINPSGGVRFLLVSPAPKSSPVGGHKFIKIDEIR